mmetsp:Transcript_3507/g.12310  ORF Transcript_3507/g.12310 Transcript_3507/m.12310 type:complete len:277 (+) Transcript_3507:741-1571(+)
MRLRVRLDRMLLPAPTAMPVMSSPWNRDSSKWLHCVPSPPSSSSSAPRRVGQSKCSLTKAVTRGVERNLLSRPVAGSVAVFTGCPSTSLKSDHRLGSMTSAWRTSCTTRSTCLPSWSTSVEIPPGHTLTKPATGRPVPSSVAQKPPWALRSPSLPDWHSGSEPSLVTTRMKSVAFAPAPSGVLLQSPGACPEHTSAAPYSSEGSSPRPQAVPASEKSSAHSTRPSLQVSVLRQPLGRTKASASVGYTSENTLAKDSNAMGTTACSRYSSSGLFEIW